MVEDNGTKWWMLFNKVNIKIVKSSVLLSNVKYNVSIKYDKWSCVCNKM